MIQSKIKPEPDPEEQIQFKRVMLQISTFFINVPTDQIDFQIELAQSRICELLDLDRSALWQTPEGTFETVELTHYHQPQGCRPGMSRMNGREFFPWTLPKVLANQILAISKMTDLPAEAARDLETWHLYETKSTVLIPLSVGGGPVFGVLVFSVIREERIWTDEIIEVFQLIAQIFANVLVRKHYEQAMRIRLAFEQMVFNLSARIFAIHSEQLDSEINKALRHVMEFFRVDRCFLLEFEKDKVFAVITHAAFGESIEPITGEINLAELFPWCYGQLRQGEHINICRVEDYPEDALKDRQSHVELGIKSALNIPVTVEGRVLRAIVINCTREHQIWPEEYTSRLRLLGEIFVNALERRQERLRLEEQLGFEMLLAEISGIFVNIPIEKIDSEIENAQRRVCIYLGLDLSALFQWSMETPRIVKMTHLYRPFGGPPAPEPMNAHEYFPWCQEQLEADRIVVVSSIEDLPAEAARDQEVWRHFGIKSALIFPMSPGGGPILGSLGFHTVQQERAWPEPLIKRLQWVAQIFTNALIRKQAEQALCESEARLTLATDAAGAGLWYLEYDTGSVWATEKTRELFYLTPEEKLTYESFFRVIHPEDRELVHQSLQEALRSGDEFLVEYRVLSPEGSIQWITSRGKRYLESSGDPDRLIGLSLDVTERKNMEDLLLQRLREIEQLKSRLEKENIYLREEIELQGLHQEIVGRSLAMKQVLSKVEQVARMDTTVLIEGETGVGKELIARAIHRLSPRKDRQMVTVNCASLPPTLMESELFGREKGAYTGAMTRMTGRFEAADGATLFLDEIGELPQEAQGKLLRVLEEGKFERLGSTKTMRVNVRIIAATNRDLAQEVAKGNFRKDLYYRLNVFPIVIPPLRQRPEDIPPLVWAFVRQHENKMGKRIDHIPRQSMQDLKNYSWPGNARELRNIIEYAMIVTGGKTLEIQVPRTKSDENSATLTLEDAERRHIMDVLRKTGWRITGRDGAAEILGLKRTTLQSKMKKLGIHRPPIHAEIKS
jgi:formate hydrogenlyase transcriptional activator